MSGLVHLPSGAVFAGDYRVVRPLGSGGMGEVYVVEQMSTGMSRAMKLMRPELVSDASLRRRFEQEARVGARIESDHIAQVLAAGVDAPTGMPYLVMELLRGDTLAARIHRDGVLPLPLATTIFDQLAHAVGAAHAVGIVHRDLKPENIFLAESKRAGEDLVLKVLDFGIAKIIAEAKTSATIALGSPMWMAPEQTTHGGNITPMTDVWALGLITFYVLVGRPYWRAANAEGTTLAPLLREMILDPLAPATARANELGVRRPLPAGFDTWFARSVAREPEARFVDARLAHRALRQLLTGESVPFEVPRTQPMAPAEPSLTAPATSPQRTEYATPAPRPAQGTERPSYNATERPSYNATEVPASNAQASNAQATMFVPDAGPAGFETSTQTNPHTGTQTPAARGNTTTSPLTQEQRRGSTTGPSRAKKRPSALLAILSIAGAAGIGLACFFVLSPPSGGRGPAPDAPVQSATIEANRAPTNEWIRIEAAPPGYALGVASDDEAANVSGFRPARKMSGPTSAFEIQQHEVTWGEITPWLEKTKKEKDLRAPPNTPQTREERAMHPVVGVPWTLASEYCQSLPGGGDLPTEAQWEFAARGVARHRLANEGRLDLDQTNVFRGPGAKLVPVMSKSDDRTPGPREAAIFDVVGNALEWTRDLYLEDSPGRDDGWKQSNGVSFRAVRGLPVYESFDSAREPVLSVAARQPVCANGPCVPSANGAVVDDQRGPVLVRAAPAVITPDAGAPAAPEQNRALVLQGLIQDGVQIALGRCFDGADWPTNATVDLVIALPQFYGGGACYLANGTVDTDEGDKNCCINPSSSADACAGARYITATRTGTITLAPTRGPAIATLVGADAAVGPTECARRVVEQVLLKKSADPATPSVKWPGNIGAWSGTVSLAPLRIRPPTNFDYIGFRCVKEPTRK